MNEFLCTRFTIFGLPRIGTGVAERRQCVAPAPEGATGAAAGRPARREGEPNVLWLYAVSRDRRSSSVRLNLIGNQTNALRLNAGTDRTQNTHASHSLARMRNDSPPSNWCSLLGPPVRRYGKFANTCVLLFDCLISDAVHGRKE